MPSLCLRNPFNPMRLISSFTPFIKQFPFVQGRICRLSISDHKSLITDDVQTRFRQVEVGAARLSGMYHHHLSSRSIDIQTPILLEGGVDNHVLFLYSNRHTRTLLYTALFCLLDRYLGHIVCTIIYPDATSLGWTCRRCLHVSSEGKNIIEGFILGISILLCLKLRATSIHCKTAIKHRWSQSGSIILLHISTNMIIFIRYSCCLSLVIADFYHIRVSLESN